MEDVIFICHVDFAKLGDFGRKTVDALYGNLNPSCVKSDYSKETPMSTQMIKQQVRWQDLTVRSEVDVVLEIAKKEGWQDCEIFGHGSMITGPQESMGWKLIPADLYKYSIPTEAVARLHQIINAGVRVQGVVIADDERRTGPSPTPAQPKVSLFLVKPVVSWIGKALLGFIRSVRAVVSFSGKALLGFIRVAGILALVAALIALVSFVAQALIHFWPVIFLGLFVAAVAGGTGTGMKYDPKLVILVDDGKGGTVWVSLFTWYD